MKNLSKKSSFAENVYALFTNTAINSSSLCPFAIFQEPKAPDCLIKREIQESKQD